MTVSAELTIQELEWYISTWPDNCLEGEWPVRIARQLIATMQREERLRELLATIIPTAEQALFDAPSWADTQEDCHAIQEAKSLLQSYDYPEPSA